VLHPTVGTIVFGRYELRRELARGGMGSVWQGADKRLKRPVAVKLLVPLWGGSTDVRARFEREAMAAARLQSPHIVQIYDYGIEQDCPFIVMELLEGEDLRTRLKRVRVLGLEAVGRILVECAKALSEAHAAGIVHRDLKPDNVFLARSRDEEIVKVLDFGVAKVRGPEQEVDDEAATKAGAILGSPQYMSPEQGIGSQAIDYRTDLWSLGVIAFRALTGKLPFEGATAGELILNIHTQPLPAATVLRADLPPLVDVFFERALARKPEDRFASARELAEAFARIAPVSFPSLSMPEPVRALAQAALAAAGPQPGSEGEAPPPAADAGGAPLVPGDGSSGVGGAPVGTFPSLDGQLVDDSAAIAGAKRRRRIAAGVSILVAGLAGLTLVIVLLGRSRPDAEATATPIAAARAASAAPAPPPAQPKPAPPPPAERPSGSPTVVDLDDVVATGPRTPGSARPMGRLPSPPPPPSAAPKAPAKPPATAAPPSKDLFRDRL
jgi:serine/threonine-protein kinase